MSRRHAVVTGIGAVVGSCCGIDQLRARLAGNDVPRVEVDRSAGYHAAGSSRFAILNDGGSLTPWLQPAESRRMSHMSKMAVAATRMALADARLEAPVPVPNAVIMATAFGAVTATEQIVKATLRDNPDAVSPFEFAESVANAPAAHIAIAAGAHGPSVTLAQREAGGLTALGRAAEEIASSRANCVLAGSVDEMPPVLHALLDRFGALARPESDGVERARPFHQCRTGFIAAEGAAVMIVEPDDEARRRSATIRVRIRGYRGAFMPASPRIGWATDHRPLAGQLRTFLASQHVNLRDIDRIVSGASGSVGGDHLEASVLKEVWGSDTMPPVITPKEVVGEYGGGFLGAALLAAEDARRLTLVQALASGGSASWVLFEAP